VGNGSGGVVDGGAIDDGGDELGADHGGDCLGGDVAADGAAGSLPSSAAVADALSSAADVARGLEVELGDTDRSAARGAPQPVTTMSRAVVAAQTASIWCHFFTLPIISHASSS
jgi:hypothetical protein